MAQVKLTKIGSTGFITEMDTSADEITLETYTANAGGSFTVTSGVAIDTNITFNAVTDTIAGIQNQNLVDKTAAETISGAFDFSTRRRILICNAFLTSSGT